MTIGHPGFADPVADAQGCFRAVLDAMAHPGRVVPIGAGLVAPPPLSPAAAAVLLTLVDAETPVWLDSDVAAAGEWVRFHCGVTLCAPGDASFAVCLGLPPLEWFGWGTHEGPETSATVIVQLPHFDAGPRLRLHGPGLEAPVTVCLGPLPHDFAARWQANREAFPRGVDLVLCAGAALAALPRSVTVEMA